MAEPSGVADGLRRLLTRAGLAGAVTDTVGPVGLSAEASSVASGAAELGVGNDVHVVDTHLLNRVSIARINNSMHSCAAGEKHTAQEPRDWAMAAPAATASRANDCFILLVVVGKVEQVLD